MRPTEDAPFTFEGVFNYKNLTTEGDGSKWFELVRADTQSAVETIRQERLDEQLEEQVQHSKQDSSSERAKRLAKADPTPKTVTTQSTAFIRNADVIAEVLARANGICEGCNHPAPFNRAKDGTPYLEVHHKIPLAQGGKDTVENAVAFCPNCHRKAHYG